MLHEASEFVELAAQEDCAQEGRGQDPNLERAHVTGGVIWLLILVSLVWRGQLDARDYTKVEIAGLYWHFVDIVWVAIFTVIYLIP